jgi:hypothetical protein
MGQETLARDEGHFSCNRLQRSHICQLFRRLLAVGQKSAIESRWTHATFMDCWGEYIYISLLDLNSTNVLLDLFLTIEAFQLLFVGCLTRDSTKVSTSTFKSRHHQKKASPFLPLPQPPHHHELLLLLLSWPLQSLNSLTPTIIFGKAGGTLEYCWSIAGH